MYAIDKRNLIYLFRCVITSLEERPSVRPSVRPSIHPFVHLFIYPSIRLSVCFFWCHANDASSCPLGLVFMCIAILKKSHVCPLVSRSFCHAKVLPHKIDVKISFQLACLPAFIFIHSFIHFFISSFIHSCNHSLNTFILNIHSFSTSKAQILASTFFNILRASSLHMLWNL